MEVEGEEENNSSDSVANQNSPECEIIVEICGSTSTCTTRGFLSPEVITLSSDSCNSDFGAPIAPNIYNENAIPITSESQVEHLLAITQNTLGDILIELTDENDIPSLDWDLKLELSSSDSEEDDVSNQMIQATTELILDSEPPPLQANEHLQVDFFPTESSPPTLVPEFTTNPNVDSSVLASPSFEHSHNNNVNVEPSNSNAENNEISPKHTNLQSTISRRSKQTRTSPPCLKLTLEKLGALEPNNANGSASNEIVPTCTSIPRGRKQNGSSNNSNDKSNIPKKATNNKTRIKTESKPQSKARKVRVKIELKLQSFPAPVFESFSDLTKKLSVIKEESSLFNMNNPSKLTDFFKCMDFKCTFTTTSQTEFEEHLKTHKGFKDSFCAYCLQLVELPDPMVKHLLSQHSERIFQCSLCFYRSKSTTNFYTHVKYVHVMEHPTMIRCPKPTHHLPCPERKVIPIGEFICGNCTFQTMITQDFVSHHNDAHEDSKPTCGLCKLEFSKLVFLMEHFDEKHQLRSFCCKYCDFSTKAREILLLHCSLNHGDYDVEFFYR